MILPTHSRGVLRKSAFSQKQKFNLSVGTTTSFKYSGLFQKSDINKLSKNKRIRDQNSDTIPINIQNLLYSARSTSITKIHVKKKTSNNLRQRGKL